jgi:hypothetical protein
MGTGAFDSTWHVAVRFALCLAVYRVAFLVARRRAVGVFQAVAVFREGLRGWPPVTCVNCLSVWLSLPLAAFVGGSWIEQVVAWWALSGAAVVIDRATRDPFEIEPKGPLS